MTSDRKKPGVTFWAAVVVVVVLVYSLSFGPVFWMLTLAGEPEWAFGVYRLAYAPIILVYENGPQPIHDALEWYGDLWAPY